MAKWLFFVYIGPDQKASFAQWREEVDPRIRFRVDKMVRHQSQEAVMKEPFKRLVETDGLWELRIVFQSIEYRPIGFQGPRDQEFTFLAAATKTGRKPTRWDPRNVLELADVRMRAVGLNRNLINAYRFDSPAAN
jgi:hypothetical protein